MQNSISRQHNPSFRQTSNRQPGAQRRQPITRSPPNPCWVKSMQFNPSNPINTQSSNQHPVTTKPPSSQPTSSQPTSSEPASRQVQPPNQYHAISIQHPINCQGQSHPTNQPPNKCNSTPVASSFLSSFHEDPKSIQQPMMTLANTINI